MSDSPKSPYIENPGRLAYVIAAIQATGVHGFHQRLVEDWASVISGDSLPGAHWKKIFEEHPEFFRLVRPDATRTLASLVWRQQLPRVHLDSGQNVSPNAWKALSDGEKGRVARKPLEPPDIKTLIETAINLNSSAMELEREARWWIPVLASFLGGLIGAALGFLGATLKG